MYRKIIVATAAAAAIVGSGTAALAATGPGGPGDSQSPPPGTHDASHHPKHPGLRDVSRHAVRGQIVLRGKAGKFVTEDFARGTATDVSTNLIQVHSADGARTTFAVTPKTKVESCPAPGAKPAGTAPETPPPTKTRPPKCTATTIGKVAPDDRVLAIGTGSTALTAHLILDFGPAPAKTSSPGSSTTR